MRRTRLAVTTARRRRRDRRHRRPDRPRRAPRRRHRGADQPAAAAAAGPAPKKATSEGYGGAVCSVDPYATKIGLKVLKRGGNAVDAAVATAAALGLTEPFSAGIGGGGYFVVYNAKTGKVQTLDGRETAPKAMPDRRVHRPGDRQALQLHPRAGDQRRLRRRSGHPGDLGARAGEVGHLVARATPCSPRSTWPARASRSTRPSAQQTLDNEVRFKAFTSTKKLYFKGGDAPAVGLAVQEQGPRRHLRPARRQGRRAALPGQPRQGDRRRRAQAADDRGPPTLPVPPGFMKKSRPARLPRARAEAHQGRLPRLRRLRHGAVLQRRLDRR